MTANLPARRTPTAVAVRRPNLPAVPAPPPAAELPEPRGSRIGLFDVAMVAAITIPAAGAIASSVL